MKLKPFSHLLLTALFLALLCLFSNTICAQTTEFTYQGKLHNSSVPATGNYDFEFRLYDAVAGGTILGTQTKLSVPVLTWIGRNRRMSKDYEFLTKTGESFTYASMSRLMLQRLSKGIAKSII